MPWRPTREAAAYPLAPRWLHSSAKLEGAHTALGYQQGACQSSRGPFPGSAGLLAVPQQVFRGHQVPGCALWQKLPQLGRGDATPDKETCFPKPQWRGGPGVCFAYLNFSFKS